MDYDIVIIGAGPGGYVAAIHGAHKGRKVLLVEKDEVGGICLNKGCIPTKAIKASAEALFTIRRASEFGINIRDDVAIDIAKIIARKDDVVAKLVKGIGQLLKGNGIDLIKGTAILKSANTVTVDGREIQTKNIVIATGSSWVNIPGLTPDGKLIVTSDHMLQIKVLPKKLLVVGGGGVGSEFASIMQMLGAEVTIVEMLERILPQEDTMAGKILKREFEKRGIKVYTSTMVKGVEGSDGGGKVTLDNGETIFADNILVSVGRHPYTEGLNLDGVGIKTERGRILVDSHLKTNVDNIYAIGDVIGNYMLAHVASAEGKVAVENICGHKVEMKYDAIPRPIFTRPEVASVGLTEDQLKEEGIEYSVGRFSFQAIPKAMCEGDSEGQMVAYTGKDGRLLGAYVIGPHATELISEVGLAISAGLKAEDVANNIYPHPTNSEIIKETLEDTMGKAIHKINPSGKR